MLAGGLVVEVTGTLVGAGSVVTGIVVTGAPGSVVALSSSVAAVVEGGCPTLVLVRARVVVVRDGGRVVVVTCRLPV